MELKFTKILDVKSPSYGTDGSAGLDFYVPKFNNDFVNEFWKHNNKNECELKNNQILIYQNCSVVIPLGIKVNFDKSLVMVAANKSGISKNKKLRFGMGVVDPDYQGQIYLQMFNDSNDIAYIEEEIKIIQFLFLPYYRMELKEVPIDILYKNSYSSRGEGGFGSTGLK